MSLRVETPRDRHFLRRLYGGQRAGELATTSWTAAERRRFLDDQFRLQMLHYATRCADADRWIVTSGGRRAAETAIGRLYLDRTGPLWRLYEIALWPDRQGSGIGAAIVAWIAGAARAAGADGIDLHVAIDNPRAAAFYRRLGFERVPTDLSTHHRLSRTFQSGTNKE